MGMMVAVFAVTMSVFLNMTVFAFMVMIMHMFMAVFNAVLMHIIMIMQVFILENVVFGMQCIHLAGLLWYYNLSAGKTQSFNWF